MTIPTFWSQNHQPWVPSIASLIIEQTGKGNFRWAAFYKIAFHAPVVFNSLGGKSLQTIDCQRLIAIHVSHKELPRRTLLAGGAPQHEFLLLKKIGRAH